MLKTDVKKTKIWYTVAAVAIAVVIVVSIVYFYHPAGVKSDQLQGSISNISSHPDTFPILNVSISNPSALSNPYNVTMTLDLVNGTSVVIHYLDYTYWTNGEYYAFVNTQQNNSISDFTIHSGTWITLGINSNNTYNFQGSNFILTCSGYSGAITYNFP